MNFNIGDLVRYELYIEIIGVVTYVNEAGGTLCIQTHLGDSRWVVTREFCEVIA